MHHKVSWENDPGVLLKGPSESSHNVSNKRESQRDTARSAVMVALCRQFWKGSIWIMGSERVMK